MKLAQIHVNFLFYWFLIILLQRIFSFQILKTYILPEFLLSIPPSTNIFVYFSRRKGSTLSMLNAVQKFNIICSYVSKTVRHFYGKKTTCAFKYEQMARESIIADIMKRNAKDVHDRCNRYFWGEISFIARDGLMMVSISTATRLRAGRSGF
jgi:hypothetical protein